MKRNLSEIDKTNVLRLNKIITLIMQPNPLRKLAIDLKTLLDKDWSFLITKYSRKRQKQDIYDLPRRFKVSFLTLIFIK